MIYKMAKLIFNNQLLVLIVSLGLILRLVNLNQSLWLDEAIQVILSSSSPHIIFFERIGDFHPPLFYLLIHFWMKLGISEIWLRIPSVFFGAGTVLGLYLLSFRLFNHKVAILASLILAVSPYHIYYSQEVRMYSLAAFLAVFSAYFLICVIKEGRLINWTGYILATILLLYTHYLGFFLLIGQALYLFFIQKDKLILFLKPLIILIVLWLPWLPQFLLQLKRGISAEEYLPGWGTVLSLPFYKALPVTFLKFSLGRVDFDNLFVYSVLAFMVLTIFGFLLFIGIKNLKDEDHKILAFWLFIPLLLALVVSLRVPLNQPFRLLFVLPVFCLLVAYGISCLNKLKKIATILVIAVSLFGLSLYYLNPKFWREDWRGATNFVNANLTEDSLVVFAWPKPFDPYKWYKGRQGVGAVENFPAGGEEVNNNLGLLEGYNRVFVFEYLQDLSDPRRVIDKRLMELGFKNTNIYDFKGVGFIRLYRGKNVTSFEEGINYIPNINE